MKKIWTLFRVAVILGAVIYCFVPSGTTTVEAAGCPTSSEMSSQTGCVCEFIYSTTEWTPIGPETICHYTCGCRMGGSEPFTIEKEVVVENQLLC